MFRLFACSLCALFCLSCSKSPIVIHAEPQPVSVYVDGKKVGETPCTIDAEFWKEYIIVELKKEGYVSQRNFILRKLLDGSGGIFNIGWPRDAKFRLMDQEELDRRRRWRTMK
ncbi:PEGA domain-containing protein [Candidatus Uabimicrobium sp. HlEnr_7]|uniref:PEGA domain-containing protein n=1 Tax=Candidatus Uabimicrobium helgolandensis TaxID=3095367 RepID=UPI0035582F26